MDTFYSHTAYLAAGAIEQAQKIASIIPPKRIPRLPPELVEPYPCENCHLVNACKESGRECRAFRSYATRKGTWKAQDVGHFNGISRTDKKLLKLRFNSGKKSCGK